MTGVDPVARHFGDVADRYERGRPAYPPDAIAYLAQMLDINGTSVVVDVGAGTGKLTRALIPLAGRVIAAEPVDGMRNGLAMALPTVEVLDAAAEALPLPEASVDAVLAGQAFHWFDGPRALAEFRRVLRPGGGVGLLWNWRDTNNPLHHELDEVIDPLRKAPAAMLGTWKQAFTVESGFGPLTKTRTHHSQTLDEERFVDRIMSISAVAAAKPRVRKRVERTTRAIFSRHAAAGSVEVPYVTEVFWSRLVG